MQVICETGQERVAGHMPPLGHHVAPAVNSWKGLGRFKARGHGTVNAQRMYSTQRKTAVMADGIPSRVGEEAENKTGHEQGMLVVMQSAGLFVIVEIPSQTDGLITRSTLVAESLVHFVTCWNSHSSMVRPRQRMLSRQGSSRGGVSRRHEGGSVGHCCHCNLANSIGAIPLHSSQFMDAGASGSATFPAFGSTIFNFTSSTSNPRINAHVSIRFIENAPDDDDHMEVQGQRMQVNPG